MLNVRDMSAPTTNTTRHLKRLAAVACLALLLTPAAASADGFERVKSDDGVTVYMKDKSVRGLPVIRVRMQIHANIAEVVGVVTDINNSCTWAGRCIESRILKSKSPTRHRVYSRRKGPWPVSDRDFELDSDVKVDRGGKRAIVSFATTKRPMIKPKSGVVRVPVMRGFYKLEWAGDDLTNYEFQVEADPGGWIPTWVYRWTAKSGPFESARNLRRRVPKVRAQYQDFVSRYRKVAAGSPP